MCVASDFEEPSPSSNLLSAIPPPAAAEPGASLPPLVPGETTPLFHPLISPGDCQLLADAPAPAAALPPELLLQLREVLEGAASGLHPITTGDLGLITDLVSSLHSEPILVEAGIPLRAEDPCQAHADDINDVEAVAIAGGEGLQGQPLATDG